MSESMNPHGTTSAERETHDSGAVAEYARTAVRLDQGHIHGDGGLPERFENPGMPPHVPRNADFDERAARRAEKQVATLFGLSILGTLVFLVAYFAIDSKTQVFIPGLGKGNLSNIVLGTSLGVSLLGIGLGAVHWAKTLMPDTESVEMRHPMRSSDANRQGVVDVMVDGGNGAQLGRRPLIKYTLGGALGLFSLPLLVQVVGSLGPMPKNYLSVTYWNGPEDENGHRVFARPRLVRDPENTPIKATDVTIGSVFHVLPQGLLDLKEHVLEEKAKAAVLLMRLNPSDIKSTKEREWGYDGIVAYSKICTHVGCPVGLYEQQTHHLLCPCHQSTFDVTEDCKVIFGPAHRPLPQLKITVDNEGYLVADQPFREAIGPSFWERG
jgi:ubiquinol-cytochrome c reductase iron-sulfur subunit